MKKYIYCIIAWCIFYFIMFSIGVWCITCPSTILNIGGILIILVNIVVTIESKFFTSIIKEDTQSNSTIDKICKSEETNIVQPISTINETSIIEKQSDLTSDKSAPVKVEKKIKVSKPKKDTKKSSKTKDSKKSEVKKDSKKDSNKKKSSKETKKSKNEVQKETKKSRSKA